jgi:site-specific DNA-methyltransferase (adenine-specific)
MSDFTLSHRSKSDDWRTPPEFYTALDSEFHFNDDPCPIGGDGGLEREWGSSVFMNPPYSKPTVWVKKAYHESLKGKIVVGLLRGDTSTRWFHDWVLPYAEIRFVKGRLKFNGKRAPFPSIIAIWNCSKEPY